MQDCLDNMWYLWLERW